MLGAPYSMHASPSGSPPPAPPPPSSIPMGGGGPRWGWRAAFLRCLHAQLGQCSVWLLPCPHPPAGAAPVPPPVG